MEILQLPAFRLHTDAVCKSSVDCTALYTVFSAAPFNADLKSEAVIQHALIVTLIFCLVCLELVLIFDFVFKWS